MSALNVLGTLLNNLFETRFTTMVENSRQQTTRGIWISKAKSMNVLIMDVEGTDGRERGENQDFERKSALFSIATSEVLIINLWEHMVGLYNGANMGLLKTVFEVNLQLFSQKDKGGKTLLFFVIRDFVGNTPLASHEKTLRADLMRMWAELSKPTGLEDCVIDDFFDFMFYSLPHKILMPEKFDEQICVLRDRFMDRDHPQYCFKVQYHKRIPADGFAHYAQGCWEQIMSNKDLDLPTQQQLLAQYRCDEIAKVAFDAFQKQVVVFKRPVESGTIVDALGATMTEARDAAIQSFDGQASRYHQEVYKAKRAELMDKMHAYLHALYLGQLKNIFKKTTQTFAKTLADKMKTGNYDFIAVETEARQVAEQYFVEHATKILLALTSWSFDEDRLQLVDELAEIAGKHRAEEVKKMVVTLEKTVRKSTDEAIAVNLNASTPEMWTIVLDALKAAVDEAEAKLAERASRYSVADEELVQCVSLLRRNAWDGFMKKIADETSDNLMMVKLKNRLDEKFRYDEHGLPRVWKPEDDMDSFFQTANDEALKLIPLFSAIESDTTTLDIKAYFEHDADYDYSEAMTIFSASKQQEILTRFRREAEAMFLEAKRSLVATEAKVPYWMMVLLFVLGWNEFWAVLTSPIYLMFTIFFGFVGYIVYMLNLTGPAEQVARSLANQIVVLIQQKIREANQPKDETIEMRKMQ
jgi:hypothetical protein